MKAVINALTLHLLRVGLTTSFEVAGNVAASFVEENAELFTAPSPPKGGGYPTLPTQADRQYIVGDDPDQAIRPSSVFQPRQPGELMPHQKAAVEAGRQLCPNCQQPTNDHLPGCARVGVGGFSPMDPKARTKAPLPAAEA